tara:strand:+ start:226 stop:1191 length:966 start_codon:yes stop_codon:yes gene_type:complete
MATKLESEWLTLRLADPTFTPSPYIGNGLSLTLSLSDALALYIKLKAKTKPVTFESSARRNVSYLIEAVGDKDMATYTSLDAGSFRDHLLDKELAGASVKRVFSSIKAIYNLAASEYGLDGKNPFSKVYFPETNDTKARRPATEAELSQIQSECTSLNDEIRWLIALVSDTGMRLSEAAGLYWDDVKLDDGTPHVIIQPNAHRRLKTASSKRTIPVVGFSLWALKEAKTHATGPYVYPKYMKGTTCAANSASAATNKWIKSLVNSDISMHSLRHSMRDRLRSAQCPTEVIDQIGGWSSGSIGSKYGLGYPIHVLQEWMLKM